MAYVEHYLEFISQRVLDATAGIERKHGLQFFGSVIGSSKEQPDIQGIDCHGHPIVQ
jgi:hypothetical protein